MIYCGIDIASKSSYVYVMNAKGRRLTSGEVPTTKPGLEDRLKRYVARRLRIAIEAGNQTAWIHDALTAMGAKGDGGESDEGQADRREPVQDRQDRRQDVVRTAADPGFAASGAHAGQAGPGPARSVGGPVGNWYRPGRSCATWSVAWCVRMIFLFLSVGGRGGGV